MSMKVKRAGMGGVVALIAAAVVVSGMWAPTANAASMALRNDAEVSSSNVSTGSEPMLAGYWGSMRCAVIIFELPTLQANEQFSSANMTAYVANYGGMSNTADLYGLGYRTTQDITTSDYYSGSSPDTTDATLIQAEYLTSAIDWNNRWVNTTGGAGGGDEALVAYLNAQYAASAADRAAGETIYLPIRINSHGSFGGSWRGYQIHSLESTSDPSLTYEVAVIPEPASLALLGLGGVMLTARRRRGGV